MTSHYIENESNANQYYFDANNKAAAQVQRLAHDATYASPVTVSTIAGASEFSSYPVGVSGTRSPNQQIRPERNGYVDSDPYQIPQQHQSVAGFNKSVSQQQYQSSSSPVPQVKATVRTISSPEPQHASSVQYQQQQQQQPQPTQQRQPPQQQAYENYEQQGSPQSSRVLTQHQQHQYDSRQQLGQSTGVSAFYQAPSSAQYTHHDVDQRTESPSRGRDPNVQVQQVPIRQIPVSSHQQNDTSANYQQQSQQQVTSQPSPKQVEPQQQHEDQLQQYYSQLTPEQYQQLLRQQQIQRQQQEEQKRQQLAQQQYYLQQQQERQRTEQQQNQPSRSNQEGQHYDEHQERRVYQNSSTQEQQHRPQGQDQYDAYNYRPQPIQTTVLTNINQDSYRPQQHGEQGQPDAYYEQQRRVASQQSPSSSTYQQEQKHRSTVTIGGGPQQQITSNQQQHARVDPERQGLDEQEYYAAQLARQQQQEREHLAQIGAAQHAQKQEREYPAQLETTQRQQAAHKVQFQPQPQQQQQEQQQQQQAVQPVGIRGLMNKFTGPTKIPTYEPKNKTATSHQYSSSTHTSSTGTGQTTTTKTTQSSKICSMTYSALPKPQEPPVNSVEYYKMMQQGNVNSTSSNVQQTAAPPHIQGPAPGFGALRERFKGGSVSESTDPIQDIRRQQQQSNAGNSSLGSLRDQYVNRAKESTQSQEESFSQRIQSVSRSTVASNQSAQHQQPITLVQNIPQQEELEVQSESVDDQVISSEGAVAEGGSSDGASPIENDTNLVTAEVI